MTFGDGFIIKRRAPFTFRDLDAAIQAISRAFGEGHLFVPENVRDGGILWKEWPGKPPSVPGQKELYKSMRIWVRDWPAITDDAFPKEILDQPVEPRLYFGRDAFFVDGDRFRTILLAIDETPHWTLDELRTVKEALEVVLPVKITHMPHRKRDLLRSIDKIPPLK